MSPCKSLLFIPLLLFSCREKPGSSVRDVAWLNGTWMVGADDNILYESWRQTGENEMAGKSYVLRGNDTIIFESMRLLNENGTLFYKPTVSGQNHGKEISFRLASIRTDEVVFENKEHDFPQRISYRIITRDSLAAEISGVQKGKQRTESFGMRRQ
jgi:hypothetical protein